MYKPLQKKNSSWNPTSIQKKGKGKPGTFTVQTFRDRHEDVPKAPRVAAAGMVENVMRAMAAREQEHNRTAAVEPQSPAIETATPEVQSKEIGIQRECAECAQEKQSSSAAEGKDLDEMSLAKSRIQTKLTVGAPGDPYEQEADRVAAQVMSMSVVPESSPQVQRLPEERWFKAPSITPVVQRQVEPKVQMWQLLQRAGGGNEANGDLESRLNASKGGGSALAPEVRAFMEPRFGADFSAVRVHTGGEAVQMNRQLGAQAFAHGSDVYFGAGKSPGNNELMAHELTHVVQQTGAQRNLQRKPEIVATDDQQFAPEQSQSKEATHTETPSATIIPVVQLQTLPEEQLVQTKCKVCHKEEVVQRQLQLPTAPAPLRLPIPGGVFGGAAGILLQDLFFSAPGNMGEDQFLQQQKPRRYPNQTCENEVLDELQAEMHRICNAIPGESCSSKKVSQKKLARRPCSAIRTRIAALEACLAARERIQNECFGGQPDPRHENAIQEIINGIQACKALEAINCAPGHPMANL